MPTKLSMKTATTSIQLIAYKAHHVAPAIVDDPLLIQRLPGWNVQAARQNQALAFYSRRALKILQTLSCEADDQTAVAHWNSRKGRPGLSLNDFGQCCP